MATNFPASLDALTNPTSSDSLSSPSHSAQHANVNDAVEALQAKVGADSSAVTSSLDYKVAQLEAASPGKILQVVRATDATDRTTTSTSYVDANISVTITPTSTSSTILVVWQYLPAPGSNTAVYNQITNASNTALSAAEEIQMQSGNNTAPMSLQTAVGYDAPATTSATTYKGRFRTGNAAIAHNIKNATNTGQLLALEISA